MKKGAANLPSSTEQANKNMLSLLFFYNEKSLKMVEY